MITNAYVTTSATWHEAGFQRDTCGDVHEWDDEVPDPVIPDAPGSWRLVGSAASLGRLFWFWKQEADS
jgi:hypothetical protein